MFQNLKVVELASVLAGPAVGMFFAELGAEVIKIENKSTGGDMTRGWKLPDEAADSNESAYFYSVNWHKKHLFLDLDDPDDRQTARQYCAEADIVISNFKPSSARRWGLDAARLRADFPRLIFGQINAFADPEDPRPAFDIVLQAEAGFLYMTGEQCRPPARMPVALIDALAAHQLKEALLLALLRRERTGAGAVAQVSLLESAVASLLNQASNYLNAGHIPGPMGVRHPNIAPYGDLFACADDQPIVLAVGTDRQFARLCAVLGAPELSDDVHFCVNSQRVRHRSALIERLAPLLARHSSETLMERFAEAGIPAGRIRDMQAVFELPEARAMILEETTPEGRVSKRVRTNAFKID